MKTYQITFEWPNGDWTWLNVEVEDYHTAMCTALARCPVTCRTVRIEFLTPEQAKANAEFYALRRMSI